MEKYILTVFLAVFLGMLKSNGQVGINTNTPLSTLDINGNLSVKHIRIVGNGNDSTIETIDNGVYISVDPQMNDEKFQLPDPTAFPGRIYLIRNVHNSNTAQLTTPVGSFFLKGVTTGGSSNIYMYNNHLRTLIIGSDGLNWTIFNSEDGISIP